MKKTLTAVLILLPLWALASTAQTPAVNSRVAPLQENTSSGLSTQQQARQWGLSDSDWSRYQTLMKGERGIMSPGLDPLTALGVETDNSAERRRLAELWVKHEYQRTGKELAFQRDVNLSKQWLSQHAAALGQMHATGMVVSVKDAAELSALRALAPSTEMVPVSGGDLARRLHLAHYPVLITDKGLSQ